MATYITAETLTAIDLTDTNMSRRDLENRESALRAVPESRRDEAHRCYMIAYRIGGQYHLNINWQLLGGKSDAQMVEILDARVAQHQRSRGAKALANKCGVETARKITGKNIKG